MSKETSAKRYAKALFEVAKEQKAIAEIRDQFNNLVEIINTHKELRNLLSFPLVTIEDKKELLGKLLTGNNAYFINFVMVMIEKNRDNIFRETYQEYVALEHDHLGIAEAQIVTAQPISQEEIDQIATRFGQQTGKKIIATNVVDPSLLGGVMVRIGDRLYDGSVKNKLERFHKTLVEK